MTPYLRILSAILLALAVSACDNTAEFPYYDPAEDENNGPDENNNGPDENNNGPDENNNGPDENNNGPDENNNGPDENNNGPVFDNRGLSIETFANDVTPILDLGCTYASCHSDPKDPGATLSIVYNATEQDDLESNLSILFAYINFGTPANSRLLRRGRDEHRRAAFSDEDYCIIYNWIAEPNPEAPPCDPEAN